MDKQVLRRILLQISQPLMEIREYGAARASCIAHLLIPASVMTASADGCLLVQDVLATLACCELSHGNLQGVGAYVGSSVVMHIVCVKRGAVLTICLLDLYVQVTGYVPV